MPLNGSTLRYLASSPSSVQLAISFMGPLAVKVATGSVPSSEKSSDDGPDIARPPRTIIGSSLTSVTVTSTIKSACIVPSVALTVTSYTLSPFLSIGFSWSGAVLNLSICEALSVNRFPSVPIRA